MYYGKFLSFKKAEKNMFKKAFNFINNGIFSLRFIRKDIGIDF